MGLDMYLVGRRGFYDDNKTAESIAKKFPELSEFSSPFGGNVVTEVNADVGYWRKANAIHRWFVDTVQQGEDDCGRYYVSREDLEELKKVCDQILSDNDHSDNLAEDLLPPTSGFFFGSTEIDEHYYSDLKYTSELVERCLKMPEQWTFYYQSSW